MMDSFHDSSWDLLDYNIIEDTTSADFYWANQSTCLEIDVSAIGAVSAEKGCKRKREYNESCSRAGTKACREKMRREKMNDRFLDLSSILEPGRPAKTDKSAILGDAIRVLNQLRTEAQELKEKNEKLQEDIKNLKAEKNELREEKLLLKADKEKILKAMTAMPTGFAPTQATFHAGRNKMMAFPNFSGFQMWQWISPAVLDTSQDHVLRPPVA
nr:basic helix-loop-helix transcription factor [Loropetalum chinense var. rubrum]